MMGPLDHDDAEEMMSDLGSRLSEALEDDPTVSRRALLGGLGLAGSAALAGVASGADHGGSGAKPASGGDHGHMGTRGEYQTSDFDPHEFLRTFNTGREGQDGVEQEVYQEDGRTVREFTLVAEDRPIEVAPGVFTPLPAWTYNGQVPGPTLRAVEGDLVRITFRNHSAHDHTIHPHLRNPRPEMDGVGTNGPGVIEPGDSFTYEWPAKPAGVHLYHCHSAPLKAHIHRGLYGTIVVDPDPEKVRDNPRDYVNYHGPVTDELRETLAEIARSRNHEYAENDEVDEMVMVMNGFDLNFDGDNEVYSVNTRAFAYNVGSTDGRGSWRPGRTQHPIQVDRDRPARVYLVNATEFDPINSFHTHSQFFDYYDHGTTLMPTKKNVDTVMLTQAQRGIIELDYSEHEPGLYMFHAHQSEFAELGWMSFFEVV